MFETKTEELIPLPRFARRVALSLALAGAVLALGLSLGVLGYHYIAGFHWIDAFLEASMILTGMGPVGALNSNAAKIFSSLYALFSGVVFLSVMAITITPVVHRILHTFHVDDEDIKGDT
jgi:hypothetical protein